MELIVLKPRIRRDSLGMSKLKCFFGSFKGKEYLYLLIGSDLFGTICQNESDRVQIAVDKQNPRKIGIKSVNFDDPDSYKISKGKRGNYFKFIVRWDLYKPSQAAHKTTEVPYELSSEYSGILATLPE